MIRIFFVEILLGLGVVINIMIQYFKLILLTPFLKITATCFASTLCHCDMSK